MAKEDIDNKTTVHDDAPKATTQRSKRPPAKPGDVKSQTQEAKDLRTLVAALGQKNAPTSSKEITAYAKETLKLVAKSQKSESAAFRREATKSLVDFRNFVEKTEKVSEIRRTQLLSQIDSVTLDAKNASMMLLSVAKAQAKNIRISASREAAAEKMKAKEFEKKTLSESTSKAKALEEDTRLKSKVFKEEQEKKFKAIAEERQARYKALVEKSMADIAERKDKLKQRKDEHKLKVEKDAQELQDSKKKNKLHYDNLKLQLKQNYDARSQALDQAKQAQSAKNAQAQLDLKDARAEAATKIKKLKTDLRDDYQIKVRKNKADLAQRKSDLMVKNKDRIQKIRLMTVEHKQKLKKIEDDFKAENILKKRNILKEEDAKDRKQSLVDKKRGELGGKVKEGIYEANPLLAAAGEIAGGLGLGHMAGKLFGKKDKKATAHNSSFHAAAGSKTASTAPAAGAGGSPSGSGSGAASSGSGGAGGMFSGLLAMIPSISEIVGGISSFFTGIVGGFTKILPIIAKGARFIPAIAVVASIVGGIWSFIEGFNDASSLFGDKIQDDDYVRKIFSGFTNVFGSILGIFDTVAGWLGFDTDLEGSFKKGAVKLFNAILDTFKSVVGGLASLLEYIPGMGGIAKNLKTFSESKSPGELQGNTASPAGALSEKTKTVQDLKDEVDTKKSAAASVQVVSDSSVKQTSTTIVQQKLDTRNQNSSAQLYGGGATGSF